MSTSLAAGFIGFTLGLVALTFLAAGLVHLARDLAEDRRREARLAEEWRRRHQRSQDIGRYDTDVPGRPE